MVARVMHQHSASNPSELKVPRRFCLLPGDALLMPEGKYVAPYADAIRELAGMVELVSPLPKLELLGESRFHTTSHQNRAEKFLTIKKINYTIYNHNFYSLCLSHQF